MEVTYAVVAAIPFRNLRVSREEFVDLWRAAEDYAGYPSPDATTTGQVSGIVEVCRWLAGVTGEAPVTGSPVWATTQSIEAEVAAVQRAIETVDAGEPPTWMLACPGRADGLILTFAWAWLGGELPTRRVELPAAPGA